MNPTLGGEIFMPPPRLFNGVGGHIVLPLSVRTSVRPVRPVRPSVPYVTLLVSVRYLFERIGVLD